MTTKRLIGWLFFLTLLAAALVAPVHDLYAAGCEKGVCKVSEEELNALKVRIAMLTEAVRVAREETKREKYGCEVSRRGA